MSLNYRPEIDGLRAVAVVPVILFHADFSFSAGGFVGVDIFFVISGFLISSIIAKELVNGKFSIIQFYERRARRILPALFFISITCIPFSLHLMPPNQLDEFAKSLGAVALFVSNILFWQQIDYFATAAELKPLLHTWSLGIEEQFYVLFPLLMIFTYRSRSLRFAHISVVLLILSLTFTEYAWRYFPSANYYLIFSRAWELLLGTMAALFSRQIASTVKHFPIQNADIYAFTGLAMITWSVLMFSPETPFPSLWALLPTVGTALVLVFARDELFSARLLALAPLVFVGKLSYSLYLWHQPYLAFARLAGYNLGSWQVDAVLLSLVAVSAYLSWRLVEMPFRQRSFIGRNHIFAAAATGSIFMIAFAAFSYIKGFQSRYLTAEGNTFLAQYQGRKLAVSEYREECNFYMKFEIDRDCLNSPDAKLPIALIWGDSHAQALGAGLRRNFGDKMYFAQLATSACRPQLIKEASRDIPVYPENNRAFDASCRKANATAIDFLKKHPVHTVIFDLKGGYKAVKWQPLLDKLEGLGVKRVLIVGPVPQWNPSLPFAYASQLGQILPVKMSIFLRQSTFEQNNYLKNLSLRTEHLELHKVLPIDFLCRNTNECRYLVPGAKKNDRLMVFDYGHLSYSGANYLARALFSKYF